MTNFTWIIHRLTCYPQKNGYTNVVFRVGWRVNGQDGSDASTAYGNCDVPEPGLTFIPYDDLTEQDVLDWIWENGVDKAEQEAAVQGQIDTIKNPPIIVPPLPWAT